MCDFAHTLEWIDVSKIDLHYMLYHNQSPFAIDFYNKMMFNGVACVDTTRHILSFIGLINNITVDTVTFDDSGDYEAVIYNAEIDDRDKIEQLNDLLDDLIDGKYHRKRYIESSIIDDRYDQFREETSLTFEQLCVMNPTKTKLNKILASCNLELYTRVLESEKKYKFSADPDNLDILRQYPQHIDWNGLAANPGIFVGYKKSI